MQRIQGPLNDGQALADRLYHRLVLDVIGVIGLQLDGNACEGALQGLLGGGVDHLGLEGWVCQFGLDGHEKRVTDGRIHVP